MSLHQTHLSALRLERVLRSLAIWYRLSWDFIDELEDVYLEFHELENFLENTDQVVHDVAHELYVPYLEKSENNPHSGKTRVRIALSSIVLGNNGSFTKTKADFSSFVGPVYADKFTAIPFVQELSKQILMVREMALMQVSTMLQENDSIELEEGVVLKLDQILTPKGRKTPITYEGAIFRYLYRCEKTRLEKLGVINEQESKHYYRIQSRRKTPTYSESAG